jgi:hypothetical protein
MIKLVEFDQKHLAEITPKSCHDGEMPEAILGQALTLTFNDTPAAIFVWKGVCPGVMQVSAFISEIVKEHPFTLHKTAKHLIGYAFAEFGIQRMQMSVRCGFNEGWDWARSLGFQCEGIMRQYGPNKSDYWLFARVA